jgi:hypothetical protein
VGWCATAVAAAPTDSQNPTDHARGGSTSNSTATASASSRATLASTTEHERRGAGVFLVNGQHQVR